MDSIELIGIVIGSNALSIILTNFLNRRSTSIENQSKNDKVLYDRIKFLENRVDKLEQHACFDKDCNRRL